MTNCGYHVDPTKSPRDLVNYCSDCRIHRPFEKPPTTGPFHTTFENFTLEFLTEIIVILSRKRFYGVFCLKQYPYEKETIEKSLTSKVWNSHFDWYEAFYNDPIDVWV